MSQTIETPWGRYTDYYRSQTVVFKVIEVDPGQRLSLQSHEGREEIWVCLSGQGTAEIGAATLNLFSGAVVVIPQREVHRLSNIGAEPLIVAELQHGQCDEQDIRRYSDDYGRAALLPAYMDC